MAIWTDEHASARHDNTSVILAPSAPTTKALFLIFTALLGAYLVFHTAPLIFALGPRTSIFSAIPATGMSSASAQGWHERAQPHPSAPDFTPSKDALVFAVLLNAQADPDGFTVALFRPDIAVDGLGRVLQVKPNDFKTLAALSEEATRLPDTGSFMNAWRVAHDRTEQKIDRLFAKDAAGNLKETSVQGWDPERKTLKRPVGDYEELPPVLQELFGYIQEGSAGYGQVKNQELISNVKALVQ